MAAGQNTADLAVTAVNLGTATVTDGAGNAANLTGAVTNPAGTLQIDTTAPTVSSVAASGTGITAGTGDLGIGSVVTLTLNLSEAVTVAGGTPTLTLNDGGTATYTGGSGTNALTFSYTVAAGQNTSDLAVTAVNLGTATVKDGAGNAANLTGAVTNPAGTLQIDTTPPGVPTVASFSPDSGTTGDGITNANHVTLTGTATAGITVEVFDGATQIGTATANGERGVVVRDRHAGQWQPCLHRQGDGCSRQSQRRLGCAQRHHRHRGAGRTDGGLVLAGQRCGRRRHHQRQSSHPDRDRGGRQHGGGVRRRHPDRHRERQRQRRLVVRDRHAGRRQPRLHRQGAGCGRQSQRCLKRAEREGRYSCAERPQHDFGCSWVRDRADRNRYGGSRKYR